MIKILLLFIALIALSIVSIAEENLLINVYNRNVTSLSGTWNYIVDPYETVFYNYHNESFENQKFPEKKLSIRIRNHKINRS